MRRLGARKIVNILLVLIFVLGVASYTLFEFRHVLVGPEIAVLYPENGAFVNENIVTIEGETKNISFLSMNDTEIFIDTEGRFSETRAVASGYNVVEIYGRDRHGKEETKNLEFFVD